MHRRPSRRPSPHPSRRPSQRRARPVRGLAAALTAGALLTTAAACSGGDGEAGGSAGSAVSASPVAEQDPAAPAAPALTEAQAKKALITTADLGEEWTPTQGAAMWRDGLLKGTTDTPDCQRLLDGLYAENLLGKPTGARAVVGFDDDDASDDSDEFDDEEQLRYQVAAYDRAALDKSLGWLKELPVKCGQFTSTDARGGQRTVEVVATPPPSVGDAREGLRMTVTGETEGSPVTLTLDFAAVRVGDNAITLTNGGLDDTDSDATAQATTLGTQRLQNALALRTHRTG